MNAQSRNGSAVIVTDINQIDDVVQQLKAHGLIDEIIKVHSSSNGSAARPAQPERAAGWLRNSPIRGL